MVWLTLAGGITKRILFKGIVKEEDYVDNNDFIIAYIYNTWMC